PLQPRHSGCRLREPTKPPAWPQSSPGRAPRATWAWPLYRPDCLPEPDASASTPVVTTALTMYPLRQPSPQPTAHQPCVKPPPVYWIASQRTPPRPEAPQPVSPYWAGH